MRRVIPGPCPVCQSPIEFVYTTETIPYFFDILLISARCDCGYRYIDTMILGEGEPVRWTLRVEGPADLASRVVRSSTGTLLIPEFGVRIEPGPACEAFITNVEGVLLRITRVLEGILTWAEGDEREEALRVKAALEEAREGSRPFTLVVEDVDGNSAILSPKAEKEPFSEREEQ